MAQEVGKTGAASLFGPFASDVEALPGVAEITAAWPAEAKANGLGGSAVALHCADMRRRAVGLSRSCCSGTRASPRP